MNELTLQCNWNTEDKVTVCYYEEGETLNLDRLNICIYSEGKELDLMLSEKSSYELLKFLKDRLEV